MALGEFELIDRYFRECGAHRGDVALGVGDDAALLLPPPGRQLAAAVDTLVEGVHFPRESPAESIGHRALAVNLSDLAAMGAEPAWALLALTMPCVDERWLEAFANGFARLARAHSVALIGGDTTSGPLSITVTVLGFTEQDRALRRAGGGAGDALWVSGTPGDAAYGLQLDLARDGATRVLSDDEMLLLQRFRFPTPRVALGRRISGIASACIDVSDGLLGDAVKLAAASGCGVEIDLDRVPLSDALQRIAGRDAARQLAMSGGDDYELCFSVPAGAPADFPGCTRIGSLSRENGVRVHASGRPADLSPEGFDHFKGR